MKKLLFATSNENKMREIREIFAGLHLEIFSLNDLDTPIGEILEDGATFEENALIKAKTVLEKTGMDMVLADDSGLEVDFMGKAPGIQSARWGGRQTPYTIKNQMILERLKDAKGKERSARFVCAIACAYRDGRELISTGVMEGLIGKEAIGENGFGYDPIFYLPEYEMSAAQLSSAQKNQISHRGKALRHMYEQIKKDIDSL